jgi:DNA-binding IclR family transcriptional regulator
LKTFSERGYLEKISRNKGYILGPTVYSISLRHSIYRNLNNAAQLPLRNLSTKLDKQVNLSIRHANGRLVLAYHCPKSGWQPWSQTWFDNNDFCSATSRLLLTACDSKEIDEVYASRNQWANKWPEVAKSQSALLAEIKKFKHDGYTCFKSNGLWIMGFLIEIPSYPVAAIGYGVELDSDLEKIKQESFAIVSAVKKELRLENATF